MRKNKNYKKKERYLYNKLNKICIKYDVIKIKFSTNGFSYTRNEIYI